MDLTELKLKVPAGLPLFPEALQKNPYPCLFQLPQGAHIPRWQPLPPPSKLAMGSGFPHIPSIQPLLYFKAIFKDQHYTGPTRQAQANLPILRSADEHFLSKYWNISTGSRNQDVNISEWKLFSLPHGISLYFKTSLGGRQKDFCFYRQEADCGAKQLGQGHRLALRSTCLQVPSRTLHCVFNGTIFRFRMYTVFRTLPQQQKANTVFLPPFWKGLLSPKGPKTWGRTEQLSGHSPWACIHTLAHSLTPSSSLDPVAAAQRKHDRPSLNTSDWGGKGPL